MNVLVGINSQSQQTTNSNTPIINNSTKANNQGNINNINLQMHSVIQVPNTTQHYSTKMPKQNNQILQSNQPANSNHQNFQYVQSTHGNIVQSMGGSNTNASGVTAGPGMAISQGNVAAQPTQIQNGSQYAQHISRVSNFQGNNYDNYSHRNNQSNQLRSTSMNVQGTSMNSGKGVLSSSVKGSALGQGVPQTINQNGLGQNFQTQLLNTNQQQSQNTSSTAGIQLQNLGGASLNSQQIAQQLTTSDQMIVNAIQGSALQQMQLNENQKYQIQLLNSRQSNQVISQQSSNLYGGIQGSISSDVMQQQYQQLEQQLLQKHHEKQRKQNTNEQQQQLLNSNQLSSAQLQQMQYQLQNQIIQIPQKFPHNSQNQNRMILIQQNNQANLSNQKYQKARIQQFMNSGEGSANSQKTQGSGQTQNGQSHQSQQVTQMVQGANINFGTNYQLPNINLSSVKENSATSTTNASQPTIQLSQPGAILRPAQFKPNNNIQQPILNLSTQNSINLAGQGQQMQEMQGKKGQQHRGKTQFIHMMPMPAGINGVPQEYYKKNSPLKLGKIQKGSQQMGQHPYGIQIQTQNTETLTHDLLKQKQQQIILVNGMDKVDILYASPTQMDQYQLMHVNPSQADPNSQPQPYQLIQPQSKQQSASGLPTGVVTNGPAMNNVENGEVLSPDSQDSSKNKNQDSRSSKRSVVFSKSKNPASQCNQRNAQNEMVNITPGTPQNNGDLQQSSGKGGQGYQVNGDKISGGKAGPPPMLSGANTQMRVSTSNTVKVNKSIKNMVMQQQQLSQQNTFSTDDPQFQQQGNHPMQNNRAFLNSKRRSNVINQMYDTQANPGQCASTGGSAIKSNGRAVRKGLNASNMNIVGHNPSGSQNEQSTPQVMFSKTISNMYPCNQNLNLQMQQQNNQQNVIHDPNLNNSLIVVKLNQIQPGNQQIVNQQNLIQAQNMQNLQNMIELQNQQQQNPNLSQQQQQQLQYQIQLQKAVIANQQQQQQQITQQVADGNNQNSQRSNINQALNSKGMIKRMTRPQSQNNRVVQGVNNQNTMSQHSGTSGNKGGQVQMPLGQGLIQPMPNIQQKSNSDISALNIQQHNRILQIQNQNSVNESTGNSTTVKLAPQGSPQKLISTKHQKIQMIRSMNNNSSVDNYAHSDNESHGGQNSGGNSGCYKVNNSPGRSCKYFIKNQLRQISKLMDGDHDECVDDEDEMQDGVNHQDSEIYGGPANVLGASGVGMPGQCKQDGIAMGMSHNHPQGVHLRDGGMTLEDDVESMLSEQFNVSNESVFRVRGYSGVPGQGGGLQGGDSTFRCNDSMYDEDRGIISESEDGWYLDKDRAGIDGLDNKIDDISEHSSDDVSDSDPENCDCQEGVPKKVKKPKEKGEKRKKKKNKDGGEKEKDKDKDKDKEGTADPRKLVQTYKKLQEDTQDKKGKSSKEHKSNCNKDGKSNKKKVETTQQIKINIQTKKTDKSDMNSTKNNFNSNAVKASKNSQEQGKQKNDQNEMKPPKKSTLPIEATPNKKGKKNGIKLQSLIFALPKNLQECHEKFFESNCKINPQFEYENAAQAQKFLEQFEEPDGMYLNVAKKILKSFLIEYGSESQYLEAEGMKLDQEQTHQAIKDYLSHLGIEEYITVNFQKNQVAPTSVSHDVKTGKSKMNIKLPCEYREGRMMGVLDHEIGTHFLRKHNERLQQFFKKRDKFDMKTCIATEEGLACTNQMVQTVKMGKCKPFLYRSALNYYAAYQAKEMTFVELFEDLEKYVDNPFQRWKFVLRVKRGLTDTGQTGGLYKDQVYLQGAVQILSRRKTLNFKGLLCGKISLVDIDREAISSILNYEGQLLPRFMDDMDEYYRCLDVIAKTNHIDEFDPDEKLQNIEPPPIVKMESKNNEESLPQSQNKTSDDRAGINGDEVGEDELLEKDSPSQIQDNQNGAGPQAQGSAGHNTETRAAEGVSGNGPQAD